MNEIAKRETWAPASFSEAQNFAKMVAQSNFAPKEYRGKPEDCLMAMVSGNEVGLGAMSSLQNIAVINGRPSVWGDAALALVKSAPDFEYIKEWIKEKTAYCEIKRKGEEKVVRSFSWDDAKRAGLSEKSGPWKTYPKRMLQMRARSWAIRDVFPHVLKGLSIAEEANDTPQTKERNVSPQTSEILQQEEQAEEKEENEADVAMGELTDLLNYALGENLIEQSDYDTVIQKANGYKQQYQYNADKIVRKYTNQIREHIEKLKQQNEQYTQEETQTEDFAGGNSAPAEGNEGENEEEYDPAQDDQEDLDIF